MYFGMKITLKNNHNHTLNITSSNSKLNYVLVKNPIMKSFLFFF